MNKPKSAKISSHIIHIIHIRDITFYKAYKFTINRINTMIIISSIVKM